MDHPRKSRALGLGAALLIGSLPALLGAVVPAAGVDGIACTVSGADVTISWSIDFIAPIQGWVITRDGQTIAELDPTATGYLDRGVPAGEHAYDVTATNFDGTAIRIGSCAVVAGDSGIHCEVLADGAVRISWQLLIDIAVSGFIVTRNDEVIARLPPSSFEHQDTSPAPGTSRYAVEAEIPGARFLVGSCTVTVDGQPPEDLLFFSTSFAAAAGTSEVTCLERSSAGIQGWSFGVKSDPDFLAPLSVSLEDTATARLNDGAGPTFLSVNILPDGVTMAVIVDEKDTEDTLPPPDFGHPLAHIRYGAGPLGKPGDVHPIEYSDGLGDPAVAVVFVVNGFEVKPSTLGGFVELAAGEAEYLRGDSNADGIFDIGDPVHTLGYLFLGGAPPGCLDVADANATREINIADAVYGLQHLFGENGPPPPPPFPACGPGPVALGCAVPIRVAMLGATARAPGDT